MRPVVCSLVWMIALLLVVACESATNTPMAAEIPTARVSPHATLTMTSAPYPPPLATSKPFTPLPTASPTTAPEPTPTTVISPPINPPTSEQLQRLNHDFLFLSNHNLLRWNHMTHRIESLASAVKTYSVDAAGQRIALMRAISADETDVAWMDLRSPQVKSVAQMTRNDIPPETDRPDPKLLDISPDGKWIAYANPIALPTISSGQTTSTTLTSTVYAVQLDPPYQHSTFGYCTAGRTGFTMSTMGEGAGCLELLWSRDSRAIAWADFWGLWFAMPKQPAYLLTSHRYGKAVGIWHPVEWSDGSRYLLGEVRKYEWREWSIASPTLNQVVEVPAPAGIGSNGSAVWMTDDRLFVLAYERLGDKPSFSAHLWRVNASQNLTLTQELSFTFNFNDNAFPTALNQLTTDRLALVVLGSGRGIESERGIYTIELAQRKLRKLTGLPPLPPSGGQTEIFWATNGTAAIVRGLDTGDPLNSTPNFSARKSSTLYVPTDGSPQIDLTPIVGYDACCFIWLQ